MNIIRSRSTLPTVFTSDASRTRKSSAECRFKLNDFTQSIFLYAESGTLTRLQKKIIIILTQIIHAYNFIISAE